MLEYDWEYEVEQEEEVEPIINTVTKVWISLISVDYITYIGYTRMPWLVIRLSQCLVTSDPADAIIPSQKN